MALRFLTPGCVAIVKLIPRFGYGHDGGVNGQVPPDTPLLYDLTLHSLGNYPNNPKNPCVVMAS